jgi:hypothetical protein
MGKETVYALEVNGVRRRWEVYNGAPYFSLILDTSLPRHTFAALDGRVGERERWFAEDLEDWLRSLPAYTPPKSLLGILLELDALAPGLDADLALRLFLEFLAAEMKRVGAEAVYIKRG